MGLSELIKGGISTVIGDAIDFTTSVISESFRKANIGSNDQISHPIPKRNDVIGDGPKSLLHDPFSIIDQLGYKDKPTGITYWTLDDIARRVGIIGAIVQTRCNQVGNFAQIPDDPRDPGFGIKLRDKKKSPTRAAKIKISELENFITHTGATQEIGKDDFETFIRKTTRDSLIYDQLCFEIEPGKNGLPVNFYSVDSATIRIADVPVGADTDYDPMRTRYVQIYDEVVIAELASHEMCFGVRNPRTDIRMNGYGFSEIEMLINVITALLWGFEYNKKFFSQGSVTKGILNFRGSVPDSKLEAFRRHYYQLVSGVQNAWRTPVTNFEDLQYISMHSNNRDMEYGEWMNFLIKICCAIYQIDPSEIHFVFGNTGQTQSMFQSGTENRIKHSKDKGLRPLLRAHQRWLNRYVIWPIDPDFSIYFTGLDPKDVAQEIDLQKKKVSYLMTVDEARAEEDMDPLPDGKGEVILDSTWLQFSQGKEAAQQQPNENKEEEISGEKGKEIKELFEGKKEEKSIEKAFIKRKNNDEIIEYEITL